MSYDHRPPSSESLLVNVDDKLMTEKEAAKILRLSTVTLWRERKSGQISFRRFAGKIFYTRQDISEYIERAKRGFGAVNLSACRTEDVFEGR